MGSTCVPLSERQIGSVAETSKAKAAKFILKKMWALIVIMITAPNEEDSLGRNNNERVAPFQRDYPRVIPPRQAYFAGSFEGWDTRKAHLYSPALVRNLEIPHPGYVGVAQYTMFRAVYLSRLVMHLPRRVSLDCDASRRPTPVPRYG